MHPNPYVRTRSDLPWPPPQNGDDHEDSRVIAKKVWDLAVIQGLAQQVLNGKGDSLKAITPDCIGDMQRLCIDAEYAAKLVLLLVPKDHYRNSRWCHTGAKIANRPELGWVPCDAYCLTVEDDYESGEIRMVNYYIKLCLSPVGSVVLIISLHESNKG